MDEQTKQVVANALDNALTTVAIREYNRLACWLHPANPVSAEITGALKSLGRLYSGERPDYDEWDALFYHWYQPSQINLAYSMIKSTLTGRIALNNKLYVVDLGCGALAMQFGVALAAADALEEMQPISEIRIDSIDSSQDMVNIGQKLWQQFKVEVNKDSRLGHVSLACDIIKPEINPSSSKLTSNRVWVETWRSECWVSAVHLGYDDNKDNARQSLNSLISGFKPDVCFATTHTSKRELLQKVWSFMDYDEYHLPALTIEPQFSGVLPKITRWRKNLNSALQINHSYLERNVTWEWPEAAFMIHAKGPMPMDADDLPW